MNDAAPAPTPAAGLDPIARIARFARTASFETTQLTDADLEAVKLAVPAGAPIYVSAIPAKPLEDQFVTLKRLRGAGFEPVPHFVARNFESPQALRAYVERVTGEVGVTRALVIAGDRPEPAGSLRDAQAAIESGALVGRGITEIGISAYPEGHPRIADADLERALTAKLQAAERQGLKVRLVSQFTMATEPIVDLVTRVRGRGVNNPISIGLAGPTSLKTLLRFARICGVKTSAQGLMRNAGLLMNLVGAATADPIVRALADAADKIGPIQPHFFSFGGLAATARWVGAVADGRIALKSDGFDVKS